MAFEIEIAGLDTLTEAMKKAPATTLKTLTGAITTSVNIIRPIMRQEAPSRSGKLSRNIYARSKGLEGEVGPDLTATPYAWYVHQGTGIYGEHQSVIRPTTKKALYWKGALHPVRSVKGQKANPFVARTFEKVKDPVKQIFQNALKTIANSLANAQ